MVLMTILIHRRADLTPEAFRAHWRGVHGPLVRELSFDLGITRYTQVGPDADSSSDWDGLAMVEFESRAEFDHRMALGAGRAATRRLRADEHLFTEVSRTVSTWGTSIVVV